MAQFFIFKSEISFFRDLFKILETFKEAFYLVG